MHGHDVWLETLKAQAHDAVVLEKKLLAKSTPLRPLCVVCSAAFVQ
jgi:hypothetical protein